MGISIYEFIHSYNQAYDAIYSLFNLNAIESVNLFIRDEVTDKYVEKDNVTYNELLYSKYSNYEIDSVDITVDKKTLQLHIEFNICIDVEEDD